MHNALHTLLLCGKFSSVQFDTFALHNSLGALSFGTFDPLLTAMFWHFLQDNLIFYSRMSKTPLICTGEEQD